MYILFDSIINKGVRINNSTIIVKKIRKELKNTNQIVVEDALFLSTAPISRREISSIDVYYRIGRTSLHSIRFEDNRIIIVLDSSQAYDLGITLYLLEKLSRSNVNHEIIVIVLVPRTMNTSIYARLYAWLKTIGLYDIYFNGIKNNSFKLVLLDDDLHAKMITLIMKIFNIEGYTINYGSFLSLRLRRLLLPIVHLRLLAESIAKYGYLNNMIRQYRSLYLLTNYILDIAPSELWETVRNPETMSILRSGYYKARKLIEAKRELEVYLRKAIESVTNDTPYTTNIINPRKLFSMLIHTSSIKDLYSKIDVNELVSKINNLSNTDLMPVLKSVSINEEVLNYHREVFISRDLYKLIELPGKYELPDELNQVVVLATSRIPLCDDCSRKEYYSALIDLKTAYHERTSMPLQILYPEKILINDQYISSRLLHRCGLINHAGFIVSEEIGDKPPCTDLLRMIEKAML